MAVLTGLALVVLFLSNCCLADVNVPEYISMKKADINAWHGFFPMRALEEERQTIGAAVNAVTSMSDSMRDSLSSIVAFQEQELMTAQLLMGGTDAEGCIKGITDYISKAIENVVNTYFDCSYDAESKFSRLINTLAAVNSSYMTDYQRALSGIDVCAKTYPNKDSYSRLKSCVESMNNNYFNAANTTQNSVFPSPSMSYFQSTVVECASTAARSITDKGYEFIKMLIDCAALSGTVDPAAYAQELYKWKGYNDTLSQQIIESQDKNYYQVYSVEKEMIMYYEIQKQVLEDVVDSKDLSFYLDMTYSHLSDYYNTLTATSLDNPGNPSCTAAAKEALDTIALATANQSLACDTALVNTTKLYIADVYNKFWSLNVMLPSIGNVAIFECIAQGYEFAPNTISNCYDLVYQRFNVNFTDHFITILEKVAKIREYENTYTGADLPCGGTSLMRLLLSGDEVLYKLQRCLYSASGTTYSVTTPMPLTTTTSSTTAQYYSTTPAISTTTSTTPNTTYSTTTTTTPSTTPNTTFSTTTSTKPIPT